jgi:hypothetical protein
MAIVIVIWIIRNITLILIRIGIGWRRVFARLDSSASAPIIIVIVFIVICCLCVLFGTPSHVVASPQEPYG